MIRTILVDDEQHSRDYLKGLLGVYSDIEIIAECSSSSQAETAIHTLHPELVFLDVELGTNQLSFDLIKKIRPINFEIIFTTSYNKYALQAIKCSAIDYLLKPVDEEELNEALEKFRSRKSKIDTNKIESLLSAWSSPGSQQNKISLPTMNGYDLIAISDIVSCEGIRNQTLITLVDNKEILISRMLKELEELLTPYHFFRIHKSYLINLNKVKSFIKGKDGTVIMSNGKSFSVSRHVKDQFVERINNPQSF